MAEPAPDRLSATSGDSAGELRLSGSFTLYDLPSLPKALTEAGQGTRIDLSGLTRLDTAAAACLDAQVEKGAELTGVSERFRNILDLVGKSKPKPDPEQHLRAKWRVFLETLGQHTVSWLIYMRELLEYLGRFLGGLWRSVRHPSEFRLTSLVFHCQQTGLMAVPIVSLMAFLIGVVLAFQGASQLQRFGAEIFVVDLIAIAVLRELGILLTAIIVAGRTASALTAAIGSMKMREEIDAMRTLGLDPDMVLVVPRVLALIVTLPILGLVADVMGLLGGAIMSWIELGVSPSLFVSRLIADTGVNHVIAGLSKAPIFALLIGIIGCHAGMKVGNNAESLGRMTSMAVVNAIFAVIVADALFSVFFAEVGI